MRPTTRKLMLTAHIATSVGWLGAIASYIAINVPVVTGTDEHTVRAAYLMMEPVLRFVLLPLAFACLATGIAQSLGTPWGLFRHYWVTISLATTAFATVILVLHVPAVERNAQVAASPTGDVEALGGDLFHSVGGLVVLLVPLVLNIFKPRGLTRYGWRQRNLTSRNRIT